MMDKDTYKRELVRMWDNLRDDRYNGYDDCEGVMCRECPLYEIEYDKCKLWSLNNKTNIFDVYSTIGNFNKEYQK